MTKTILVVDDEKTARDYMVLAAEAYGAQFTVDTAAGVEEAVAKLNNTPYAALILDVSLPVMNGNILAVFVRKAFPNLPIAFLTNFESETAKQMGEETQAEYWSKLDKMSDFTVLQNCMSNLINGLNCEGTTRIVSEISEEGTGKVELPDEFKDLLNI
jgi:DNA-binding response OmpR family regulator